MRRILWFRRDLRVDDNPLLSLGGEVLPIFIFDTQILGKLPADDRRVSYIFSRVVALKCELKQQGLDLQIYFADPIDVFTSLVALGFDEVAASGDYDAYARERDLQISHLIDFNYLHDTYIFRPDELLKADGTPYLLFTPFYNRSKALFTPEHMQAYRPVDQQMFVTTYEGVTTLSQGDPKQLALEIASIGFSENRFEMVAVDEKLRRLALRLENYVRDRDFLALESTSELSMELRFGTLSIRRLLRFLVEQKKEGVETEPFFRQLLFRDYYAYLLYHFPYLQNRNFKYRFNGVQDSAKYTAFTQAETGVPIIDAGVRELLETGRMHNRVRMICASFFTKDLLLPWQWGEAFFARHLLDYDAASNILSWQWSAGTGVDPQPYFRIFNPYLQSKRFDKEGVYIKRYLPPLAMVDPKRLHDEAYLFSHTLDAYPVPIVVHKTAAETAIRCFKES